MRPASIASSISLATLVATPERNIQVNERAIITGGLDHANLERRLGQINDQTRFMGLKQRYAIHGFHFNGAAGEGVQKSIRTISRA
jgi:hypothetical protein